MIETSAITDRPWNGPDATTGRTVEDFRRSFEFTPQSGGEWMPEVTRAAVRICRAYGIRGVCDPAYIANLITNELVGFDARKDG